MADSMAGMFSTPEQVLAAERQARMAQTDPRAALGAKYQELGRTMGGGIGGIFGAAPQESESVRIAKQRQDIMKNVDISTREGSFKAAKMAQEAGDNQGYMKMIQHGLSIKEAEPEKKTTALRKTEELMARGVSPEQAEGIGFSAYRSVTDPTTGDIIITDLRKGGARLSEEETAQVSPYLAATPYTPKIVRAGNKQEMVIQTKVKSLAKDIRDTGAPRLEGILDSVEAIINKTYGPEGKGDLPGYGITSVLPDWAVGQEAQDLRQSAVKLFNIELAERSGAAVTKQELDRLRDEFKQGAWRTDRQFVEGVKQYRNLLEDYKQSVVAGYDPAVVSRYTDQGGVRMRKQIAKVQPKPKVTEAQIRADAKKHGWDEKQVQSAIKQYVR